MSIKHSTTTHRISAVKSSQVAFNVTDDNRTDFTSKEGNNKKTYIKMH